MRLYAYYYAFDPTGWRAGPNWCEISRLEDVPDVINEHDDLLVMFLEHAPTLEIARRWFLDVLTDG